MEYSLRVVYFERISSIALRFAVDEDFKNAILDRNS